ncbi:hypothetical protein HaLaN_01079 [Haematococcus lacustris]|uniref:Uncharacterized protein n=1 Tax=Haematococcus lacustris TaxID=44745 RepID=A0A699YF43_HAELA|nr:hypothetical protein HaLaN_01079 [Haematococcus lacustris]
MSMLMSSILQHIARWLRRSKRAPPSRSRAQQRNCKLLARLKKNIDRLKGMARKAPSHQGPGWRRAPGLQADGLRCTPNSALTGASKRGWAEVPIREYREQQVQPEVAHRIISALIRRSLRLHTASSGLLNVDGNGELGISLAKARIGNIWPKIHIAHAGTVDQLDNPSPDTPNSCVCKDCDELGREHISLQHHPTRLKLVSAKP